MRLRLRAKFTLVITSLVLFVVAVLSCVFAAQLLEQLISETDRRAADLSEQVFVQAKYALVEAAQLGLHPDSDTPEEMTIMCGTRSKSAKACAVSSSPPRKTR